MLRHIPACLVNNAGSHLAKIFERNIAPIDAHEMKTKALFILRKTEDHEFEQHRSLLQSIGMQYDSSSVEVIDEKSTNIVPEEGNDE